MLSDLDPILRERGIDTIIVAMHEQMHPSFRWLSRGAKVTRGYLIKQTGLDPLLIHYPMERDEAELSGLRTRSALEFDHGLIFSIEPNQARAYGQFFDRILTELGSGKSIAFAGQVPVHIYCEAIGELELLGWKVYRSGGVDILQLARKRKDRWELGQVASVGQRTEQIVDVVRSLLRRASLVDGIAHVDGEELTIGALKSIVSLEIARAGLVEDHETILSQGRDAAVPHSRGDASAEVVGSSPIVIDIFPSDRVTGYFFDLTRTFCIGKIPDDLAQIHADVLAAHTLAVEKMVAGTKASSWQSLVCDFFEAKGYPTIRSTPATTEGYVHGLGHGVGVEVHEMPSYSLQPSNSDQIEVGDVLTIEPGLYFPDKAIGVRIEDTFYIAEDGKPVSFSVGDRGLRP